MWLGDSCPLLEAAWSLATVHHVRHPRALLRALQHHVADCVVVDALDAGGDVVAMMGDIRRQWPQLGLLVLADGQSGLLDNGVAAGVVDRVLVRTASPDDLRAALADLLARRAGGENPPPVEEYTRLQERVRHVEGLLQATFTLTGLVEAGEILGDLREVARVSVDADDMAVLLTDAHFTDLADLLDLGTPGDYLDVCRAIFLELPDDERPFYLGDEVLLRERVPDMLTSAPRVREASAAGAWSYMRLPMTIEQQLVGFVALFSQTPNRFNGAHLQLGRLFTAQVATAVRNMRLSLRLSQAEQQQRAVSEVAQLIAENLALDAVLARITEQAARLVQGELGIVLLVEPDQSLIVRAVSDPANRTAGERIPAGVGQAGMIAQTGQPSVITDYRRWEHANPLLRDVVPDEAVLFGVPLIYRERVLGVLQVARTRITPDDIHEIQAILMMLAAHAAIAIAKAQLHETVIQDRYRLRAILDHTPAAVAVTDAQGAVLLINRETDHVLSRLGISPDAIRGRRLPDLLQEYLPERTFSLPELGQMVEVYLGQAGEFLVQVAPIAGADGAVEQYVAIAQNVTELRRMDRMKANLTRVMTHDLGGMLMLVRSPFEMLEDPEMEPDQHQNLRNMLTGSLDRMSNLIEDVRNLEMVSSLTREAMTPYGLSNVMHEIERRSLHFAQDHSITVEFEILAEPLFPLEGHEFLIVQAVDNLVTNAIKYTHPGGHVRVTMTVEDNDAVVRVEDNGIGIPADKLPYIFDPFYRVKSHETLHIQGTGLGLSLVQAIVEGHGGRVTVESTHGVGSAFTLYLPLVPADAEPDSAPPITRLDLSALVNPDSTSSP